MDFDADLIGEAPCEFCGELYPLMMLIEHQSIHLVGEDYGPYLDDILEPAEVQNIITETRNVAIEQEVVFDNIQKSPVKNQPEVINVENQQSSVKSQTFEEVSKTEQKQSSPEAKEPAENLIEQKQSSLFSHTLKDINKLPEKTGKDFTTEKGEKLLVFGDEIDPEKELENEKETYKMPNNPLLNSVSKNEDVEDINNLSDDDCSESLEEFWKRARDFLKRNRARNEC